MNFPSTPELWNQIVMILAWYWDDENGAGPAQVQMGLDIITTAQNQPKLLKVDHWWLLLDAIGSYRGSPENSWNPDLEAFYKTCHDNYWKLTLPDGQQPPKNET